MKFILAFAVVSTVLSAYPHICFAQNILLSSNALYNQNLQVTDDWQLDDSSGVPVWIAMKIERNQGLDLTIYIEPKNYSLANIKKVFASLNKQYANARYLYIIAWISRNYVRDEVAARKYGYMSGEDLAEKKPSLASKEKEDLSPIKYAWYNAIYYRTKSREELNYYDYKDGTLVTFDFVKKITTRRK
jgi:hypothetical protein